MEGPGRSQKLQSSVPFWLWNGAYRLICSSRACPTVGGLQPLEGKDARSPPSAGTPRPLLSQLRSAVFREDFGLCVICVKTSVTLTLMETISGTLTKEHRGELLPWWRSGKAQYAGSIFADSGPH